MSARHGQSLKPGFFYLEPCALAFHYLFVVIYLTKLIERPIVFADVVFLQVLNGFSILHSLERSLGCFEVLQRKT